MDSQRQRGKTLLDQLTDKELKGAGEEDKGPVMDRLSNEQLFELREAFDLFDRDGDETIDVNEFSSLFRCFGMRMTPKEIEAIVHKYDADGSGDIDFEEFVEMMGNFILAPDIDAELKEAYKVFNRDVGGQDTGIDAEELQVHMSDLVRCGRKVYKFEKKAAAGDELARCEAKRLEWLAHIDAIKHRILEMVGEA